MRMSFVFRQTMIYNTKQRLLLKRSSENDLQYLNNSIIILEISFTYTKVPIKMSKMSAF